jgi:hypothetical protein
MNFPSTPSWRIEEIGPIYSIILGSPTSRQISEEYQQQAIQVCSSFFESFTVTKANGYFRGQAEDSLVFQVATAQPEKIDQLAAQLVAVFDQEGVGIVRASSRDSGTAIYTRLLPIKAISTDLIT